MIVDTHVHVLPEGGWPAEWFGWVSQRWARAATPSRDPMLVRGKVEAGLIDPDASRMVSDMDAAGVDVAVLMPFDWGIGYPSAMPPDGLNAHALRVSELHPGRFVPFACVDPRREDAVRIVERAIASGAKGLKLYPPTGFEPADRRCLPLYELCESKGIPVVFHTGGALGLLPTRYADPLLVQDVQIAYPNLTVWLAHAGAHLWWDEAVFVASQGMQTYLDLSVWVWDDTKPEDLDTFVRRLGRARDALGIERLLFASDHLSGTRVRGRRFLPEVTAWYRSLPERAERLGVHFETAEIEALLGGTAARLLNLATPSPDRSSAQATVG